MRSCPHKKVVRFLQERGKRKTTRPGTLGVPGILNATWNRWNPYRLLQNAIRSLPGTHSGPSRIHSLAIRDQTAPRKMSGTTAIYDVVRRFSEFRNLECVVISQSESSESDSPASMVTLLGSLARLSELGSALGVVSWQLLR